MTPWRPARLSTVVLTALLTGALGWAALAWWSDRGGLRPPLPWTAVVGTGALALVVLAAGLPVRRWVRGVREVPLDPLAAARTVVLAKAAAYGGALLFGWYGAQALTLFLQTPDLRRPGLVTALAATVAAAAVAGAGLLVQRWCRVPPGEGEPPGDVPASGR